MAKQPHAVVIPFPAQGHVAPLLKLSLKIAAHGVRVSFINTQPIHEKVMASQPQENGEERSLISFFSLPNGLSEEEQNDPLKLTEAVFRTMPAYLEDFILKRNQLDDNEKIDCVIADTSIGWALQVANKLGIEAVAVWPAGGSCLALTQQVPQLLLDGVIDQDGALLKEAISLSKDVPAWNSSEVGWASSDPVMHKILFQFYCTVPMYAKFYNWILCNSVYEIDSAALNLVPNILPVGPLLASNCEGTYAGNFWPEDSTCLEWLGKQTAGSVIYVAFGTSTMANRQQVEELALGLELSGHPFLWVIRSDFMFGSNAIFPNGFIDRVGDRAKFVEWAPQEKVLDHPSVAGFMSHCGWNSTMEGLSMGVPFLCWPYFADQFSNKNYICDVWKIGLELKQDGDGIVTRDEITTKIETLLSSDVIKANAVHIKEVARKSLEEGGSSFNNFNTFIQHLKSL